MTHHRSRGVDHINRDIARRFGRQRVVNYHTVERIECVWHFGRERCVPADVAPYAYRRIGLEQMHRLIRDGRRHLPQHGTVIENPDAATIAAHNQIVSMERNVAIRRVRQIQLQRLPVVTVIKRDVHPTFGASIQQPGTLGIGTNHAGGTATRLIRGESVGDARPRLAVIVGTVEVRRVVTHARKIDRHVGAAGIRM